MKQNPLELPTFSENGHLRAVIEIPAGTNHKFELNKLTHEFEVDIRDGKPRKVDFLSYPMNYGFIPRTKMDKNRGGDGDPLDVLLLAESVPTGSVIEVIPIALLKMVDLGELDNKVLAIPVDVAKRIIQSVDYQGVKANYPALLKIIATFFKHYDGKGTTEILGWSNEQAAMREINKWIF
jgi:inorganic pyrophosphatase